MIKDATVVEKTIGETVFISGEMGKSNKLWYISTMNSYSGVLKKKKKSSSFACADIEIAQRRIK